MPFKAQKNHWGRKSLKKAGAETSEESLSVTESTAEMAPTEEF